jgi:hypothetical protein
MSRKQREFLDGQGWNDKGTLGHLGVWVSRVLPCKCIHQNPHTFFLEKTAPMIFINDFNYGHQITPNTAK